jgi:hypothetical protein
MQRTEVIAKVRKLLELGRSDNVHEAAAAVARAHAIMATHAIEEAMLLEAEPEEEVRGWSDPVIEHRSGIPVWKRRLAWLFASVNGVMLYTRGRPQMRAIGKASAVQTVRYFVAYCVAEIERLVHHHGAGNGRTWRNNFAHGCVDAIAQAVRWEREELEREFRAAAANATELVRVDRAIARLAQDLAAAESWGHQHLGLRWGGRFSYSSAHDHDARAAGRAAGEGIYRGRDAARALGAGRPALPRGNS